MARFSTEYKQAFLMTFWERAGGGERSLRDSLVAAISGHVQTTEGGFLISSTSQPGHATSFFIPQAAGLTPVSLAELCTELFNRYTEAEAECASTDEETIYNTMRDRLRPVRKYRTDFTLLRTPC